MKNIQQMLVENLGDVQLIDIDRLFPKSRHDIFCAKRFNHYFRTLPTDFFEGKPIVFYSHKDKMFIEVFIDHMNRIDMGAQIFWHEIEIKLA